MPRYFFSVVLEEAVVPDPDGRELPDADAAWEAARHAALDLMKSDLGRPINWVQCRIEVRDEADEIVLEFPFAEAVENEPEEPLN
jgi:hypothetical protein